MSPLVLRALRRQKLGITRERPEWRHLYEPPLAEVARSASWYRALLFADATPAWLT